MLSESVCAEDLTTWSLEELMNVKITSASKRSLDLQHTPAATFVLTQEDIRRSGANNIPEVLRLVPGLQVAKSSANTWSISSRGDNSRFSNKLLVMVDGRSVYSLLFGGVFWEQLDLQMQDIERIEVIRGPGATLWGSNAVNGIINIITNDAEDTQGLHVSSEVGNKATRIASVRYGGNTDELAYRVYAKTRKDDGNFDINGDLSIQSTGMRADWHAGKNEVSVQSNYYKSQFGQTITLAQLTAPFSVVKNEIIQASGGHFLIDWQHQQGDNQTWNAQFYYNQVGRQELTFQDYRQVADIDISHHVNLNENHAFIWGMGYRASRDDLGRIKTAVVFTPTREKLNIYNLFFQHEWKIKPDYLHLTLGSKFEHHSVTGWGVQPNARLLWKIDTKHMFWLSVAKAIRQPSRTMRGYTLPIPGISPIPNTTMVGQGDPKLLPENMMAYEGGYRLQYNDQFSLDVSVFWQNYRNSITNEIGAVNLDPNPFPHLVIPAVAANLRKNQIYGVEISSQWQVLDWWQLHSSYSYLRLKVQLAKQSTSALFVSAFVAEGSDPRHTATVRSQMNLRNDIELDTTIRYMSRSRAYQIPAYTALDLRLSYQLNRELELSVIGKNLTDNQHIEFPLSYFIVTPLTSVQRSVHAKLTWHY